MTKYFPKPRFIELYHSQGKTLQETADALGMSITTALRWMKIYEIPRRPRGGGDKPEKKASRNEMIRKARRNGRRLAEIGAELGISRQRVWSIVRAE